MEKRELLEAAARTAGYAVSFKDGATPRWKPSAQVKRIFWNPIDEDGDAMRLQVDCFLSVELWASVPKHHEGVTVVTTPDGKEFFEPHGSDKLAATRLCITRAASAIDAQRRESE